MKRWVALVCLVLLTATVAVPVTAAERDIKVVLNGQAIVFPDQSPFIEGGRTLVPIRAVFAGMGADIAFDDATQTATVRVGATTVVIQAENQTATVNGEVRQLDVPARIVNSRIVVPLRFMVEALAGEVHWEDDTSTINLGTSVAGKAVIKARKEQETLQGTVTSSASLAGPFGATWEITGQRLDENNQLYRIAVQLGRLVALDYLIVLRDGQAAVKDGYGQWKKVASLQAAFYEAGVPVNPTDLVRVIMSLSDGYRTETVDGVMTISPLFSVAKAKAMHDQLIAAWPLDGKSEAKSVTGAVALTDTGAPSKVALSIGGLFTYVENNQSKTEEWTISVSSNWTPGVPEIQWPADMPD